MRMLRSVPPFSVMSMPEHTRQSSTVFHGSLPVCPAIQHHLYGRPPPLSSYGTTEEVITDFAAYRISGDGHLP